MIPLPPKRGVEETQLVRKFRLNLGRHSDFRIIGMLWMGQTFSGFIGFVTEVILARTLSKPEYGSLVTAMKAALLLAPLAGFGISTFWLRCFGHEGWRAFRWIPGSFRWIILSTLLTLLGILTWGHLSGLNALMGKLLVWISSVLVAQAFLELTYAVFQLQNLYYHMAFWLIMPYCGRFLVAILATYVKGDAIFVAKGYLSVSIVIICFCLPFLIRIAKWQIHLYGHGDKPNEQRLLDKPKTLFVARMAMPFGFGGLVNSAYFPISLILLTYIKGPSISAAYGVALTALTAIYFLPSAIYQKFLLPHLFRWAEHDKSRFLHTYRLGNGMMLLSGVIIGGILAFLGPRVVFLIFGENYVDAGRLLIVMSLSVPFRFISSSVGATLLTRENMQRKIKYGIIAIMINVITNILLVSELGLLGAAIALIISEVSLAIFYLIGARKHVFGPDAWRGWEFKVSPDAYDTLGLH